MTFRNRCKPRTQEQANCWAQELDDFCSRGIKRRITNHKQAFIVAEELDYWIMNNAYTKGINHEKV